MALAPQFVGHRLGSALAPHTLEFYLDYVVSFFFLSENQHAQTILILSMQMLLVSFFC